MFKPHLEQAFFYWKDLLKPDDQVIDATCGNGKDALRLAELVPQGHVYVLDIQEIALHKARQYAPNSNISFLHQCHTRLPKVAVKLVVYNLGYLPGGNKDLTTTASTTLTSLRRATQIIPIGGAVSITCYPGHAEGGVEEAAIRDWSSGLDPQKWNIQFHQWRNQSPTLFFIRKLKT
jgi:SAM-dependent methyltransferase